MKFIVSFSSNVFSLCLTHSSVFSQVPVPINRQRYHYRTVIAMKDKIVKIGTVTTAIVMK